MELQRLKAQVGGGGRDESSSCICRGKRWPTCWDDKGSYGPYCLMGRWKKALKNEVDNTLKEGFGLCRDTASTAGVDMSAFTFGKYLKSLNGNGGLEHFHRAWCASLYLLFSFLFNFVKSLSRFKCLFILIALCCKYFGERLCHTVNLWI